MISPVETIKRVPPMAWLIGGAVVIGIVVLKSGAGGSTSTPTGSSVSGAGGGGGDGQDELSNLAQGFVDLTQEFQAQTEADAVWRQGIEDRLAGAAPTNSNPPPGAGTISVHASSLKKIYSLKGGKLVAHTSAKGLSFSAILGPTQRVKGPSGSLVTVRQILSGAHKGEYIHTSDKGLTYTVNP